MAFGSVFFIFPRGRNPTEAAAFSKRKKLKNEDKPRAMSFRFNYTDGRGRAPGKNKNKNQSTKYLHLNGFKASRLQGFARSIAGNVNISGRVNFGGQTVLHYKSMLIGPEFSGLLAHLDLYYWIT